MKLSLQNPLRRELDAPFALGSRAPRSILRCLALVSLTLGAPLLASAGDQSLQDSSDGMQDSSSWKKAPSPLIDRVRRATAQFRDINALSDDWVRATPCVSGPEAGAMGVHFALPSRLGDGVVNADEPEALIYEPLPGGAFRLVGAEFIVFQSVWESQNPPGSTPALDGHLLNFVEEPNRFGLPAFYELHVWAWEQNPKGSFADWNTRVSCERQPAD
jgi:hypothetical protein